LQDHFQLAFGLSFSGRYCLPAVAVGMGMGIVPVAGADSSIAPAVAAVVAGVGGSSIVPAVAVGNSIALVVEVVAVAAGVVGLVRFGRKQG